MINCKTILITENNWPFVSSWVAALTRTYATQFWGAVWKELLALRDSRGKVISEWSKIPEYLSKRDIEEL